jgi:hypothetical protein
MSNVDQDLKKFKLQLGPEWQKLHTAKWRRPKWIKFPRSMLEDPRWLRLSPQAAKAWMSILVIASESDNLELPPPDLLFIRLRSTGDLQKRTTFAALIHELIQCRFLLKTTPELQSFRVPEIQRYREDKKERLASAREAPQGFASPTCVSEDKKEKGLSEEERERERRDGESLSPIAQPNPPAFPTSGFVPRASATSTTTPSRFTYEEAQAQGLGPPAPRFEKTRKWH